MGPPSQLPRLKNKTMDEIITRWATDLQKYQKEFKDQATKVAAWDRLLVENGEKIQKLYLQTHDAEKASNEIDRQLQSVESHQAELESFLDRYEKEVDDMYSKQIGGNEQLAGPDQERERTYKLAENLTDRLDEMGKDLGKMITEINDISGSLSKGNKPDDPVSRPESPLTLFICLDSLTNHVPPIAQPNCSRPQRPPPAAPVDRYQRFCTTGQGECRAEGQQQHGEQVWQPRQRRGGRLLPILHGTEVSGDRLEACRPRIRPEKEGLGLNGNPGRLVALEPFVCILRPRRMVY